VLSDQKIVKVYLTEHADRAYFKDSPPPRAERFYEKSNHSNEERPASEPGEYLRGLASSIPKVLEGFFKKGKILPHNVPEWLQPAVKIKHVGQGDDEVELDVDVDKLYKILLDKAISLLNEGMYDNAKNIFEQMLVLNYNNPLTLYNLACAESLKGEVKEAIAHLKEAVENGYSNLQHLIADPDLKNLKFEPDFNALLNQLKARFGFEDRESQQVEESPELEEGLEILVDSLDLDEFNNGQQENDSSDTDSDSSSEIDEDEQQQQQQDEQPQQENEQKQQDEQPQLAPEPIMPPGIPDVVGCQFEVPQYAHQVQQLIDMGFTNIESIETLLIAADGDVDAVISTLLDGFIAV